MMATLFSVRPPLHDRKHRRGVYLLPSLFTVGNMFCGYACIVYSMRGDLTIAAPFIGFAFLLDSLDGTIARLTGTTSAFGVELDSLADVISFGIAPAVLAFAWGLGDLGRVGWAAGFIYLSAAAMRLARFNIQSGGQLDKRYFVGMPSPSAAGVAAATVYAWPYAMPGLARSLTALAIMLVPAALMVSTIRFRSFKSINLGWAPSYMPLLAFAVFIVLIAVEPRFTLVILAYGYLLSAFIGMALTRFRGRRPAPPPAAVP
jgi:CDP-diacylglycerol--serine O-phosphatidyltransferase